VNAMMYPEDFQALDDAELEQMRLGLMRSHEQAKQARRRRNRRRWWIAVQIIGSLLLAAWCALLLAGCLEIATVVESGL